MVIVMTAFVGIQLPGTYCKIPIIYKSAGLLFVQKVVFAGLRFGGAYYWREFYVSKWVELDIKNRLKHKYFGLKQLDVAGHKFVAVSITRRTTWARESQEFKLFVSLGS